MKKASVLLSLSLLGCIAKKEVPVEPITMELRSGQWLSCWELCGRANNLIAITEKSCLCTKGKSFLHGFDLIKKPLIEPKEEKSLIDYFQDRP